MSHANPRKKPRTAAQKAATARMIAANKSRRAARTGASSTKGTGSTTMARKTKKKGAAKRRKGHATAKQRAAARRNIKKAQAALRAKHGGRSRSKRKGRPAGAHPVKAARRSSNKSARHRKWGRVKGHYRRTNPGFGPVMQVLTGVAAGIGVAVGTRALARRLMPEKAPLMADLAALAAVGAGIYVAKKRPILGAGIASGAAAAAVAPRLTAQLEGMMAATPAQLGVANARLAGLKYLEGIGAMHAPRPAFGMGAVAADIGAVAADIGDMGAVAADIGALSPYQFGGY